MLLPSFLKRETQTQLQMDLNDQEKSKQGYYWWSRENLKA